MKKIFALVTVICLSLVAFSCIEDLKGVSFKKEGDNTLVNVDLQDGLKVIRINASSLYILYTTDGKTWIANAKR